MYLLNKNKSIILSYLILLILVLNGCSFMDARKKEVMTNRVIAKDFPISDEDTIKNFKKGLEDQALDKYLDPNKKIIMSRNEQIDTLLRMSDENYNDFKNFIYTDNSTFESAIGIASLGMTAAATLLTGPVVPILTATDTAMKGAHSTINEKWIQNKTVSSIVAAIDTVKNQIQLRILDGKAKPYNDYTMQAALIDLHAHNNAASMLNGLIYLENMAKNHQSETQKKLDENNPALKALEPLGGITP